MPDVDLGTISIGRRFCGPPTSANGGYAAGLIAAFLEGPAEVTLRAPPPLEAPMTVTRSSDGVVVHHDATLIAEARAASLELELVEPVTFEDAVRASVHWPGRSHHVFPECFVCGTHPGPDEGLRLQPWWVDDSRIAGPWEPRAWACSDGVVRPEIVWAALDCPSAWTYRGGTDAAVLLGRLTAEVRAPIREGERISVVSWPLGGEGRKYEAATALFDQGGVARAVSRAVWIAPRR